jgi:hypothetical protein
MEKKFDRLDEFLIKSAIHGEIIELKTKEIILNAKKDIRDSMQECVDNIYDLVLERCEVVSHSLLAPKMKRLQELEKGIDAGTLIELPCKVGDTVWRRLIRDCYDEWTVDAINIYIVNGRIDYTLVCTSKSGCGTDYFYKGDKDFDWTFNNPKAEAEEQLKVLKGEV